MTWTPYISQNFPQLDYNDDIFEFVRDSVVKYNESWDFFIAQQRGMGKSTVAISLAMLLDPYFKVSNICFLIKDFIKLMTSPQRPGTVIVFDDVGTSEGGSSRKWQKSSAHEIADIMQLNRTDKIITIGTSLELDRSEKRLRAGFRGLISPTEKIKDEKGLGIDVELRIKEMDVFRDEPVFKYWRYCESGRVKRIRLYHPPLNVWHQYQSTRRAYLAKLKRQPAKH